MCASKKQDNVNAKEIKNSKAFHNYFVGEKFEAGIVLQGTEVKAIRQGDAQITESFVKIEKGNAVLYHMYVKEYAFGNVHNHNPTRPRRLLLHKKEIIKLQRAVEAGGSTVVPLRLYFAKGLIKLEVAICKGKQLHDKRETVKKKEAMKEASRAMKMR